MNPETILKLVLLLGVVLLVVAIGIRARLEGLQRLLRRPALALRAMVAMYVALPAFVLVVAWFVPLQEGVAAALLGFAVAPVLPPWAKKAAAVGGRADYVTGLQLLSTGVALLVVPLMIWIVYRVFGVETVWSPWPLSWCFSSPSRSLWPSAWGSPASTPTPRPGLRPLPAGWAGWSSCSARWSYSSLMAGRSWA